MISKFKSAYSVFCGAFLLVSFSAWPQAQGGDCSEAVKKARSRCSDALKNASSMGATAPVSSLNQAASMQAAQTAGQSAKLAEAMDFCKKQMKECQGSCGTGAAGGKSADNSGAHGGPQGIDEMQFKTPAYRAAHQRCLDVGTKDCNTPLVVQLGAQALAMTAPKAGVMFDIRGARAIPAHAPQKISWLNKKSRGSNYFLALPNESGGILGIDELFGNNTAGPDGKFAEHGWAALKKHDLNKDQVIDERDPVFAKLRLWSDINGNGLADGEAEVFTLTAKGVQAIDLSFDNSPAVTDRFGNQITMKSSVRLKTGETKLIFDLWFGSLTGK